MYLLVEVIERNVSTPTFFETLDAAEKEMVERFHKATGTTPETFSNDVEGDFDEGYDLEAGVAWCEVAGNNMDWQIFNVNMGVTFCAPVNTI